MGAGAGLSAAAGLDYNDPKMFTRKYQPFLKEGFKTVTGAIAAHWRLTEESARSYWGFRGQNHINVTFHQQEQLDIYKLLYKILIDKDYFVLTTNTDGQFFKGGFDSDRVFAPQGSFGKFQCRHGCLL
jgi:NAD-dependent SIR2 family protein deacetylase